MGRLGCPFRVPFSKITFSYKLHLFNLQNGLQNLRTPLHIQRSNQAISPSLPLIWKTFSFDEVNTTKSWQKNPTISRKKLTNLYVRDPASFSKTSKIFIGIGWRSNSVTTIFSFVRTFHFQSYCYVCFKA